MNFRDNELNDHLENGTTCNVIPARSFTSDFDFLELSPPCSMHSKVIDMSAWKKHPVTSIFDHSDSVDELGREEYRACEPNKPKATSADTYKWVEDAVVAVQERKQ
ncbi:MAG: hypothetical protein V3R25_10055 [Nitrosomonadaceae bacterium]